MLRLGFSNARISGSIINVARRCIGAATVTSTQSENTDHGQIGHEGNESQQLNQTQSASDMTAAAELKAQNNDGFFDNNVTLTGVTGKCMYNIDEEDNVHAIRIPIRYNVNGVSKTITATATRSDLITFILNNVEEGVPVCVRGTLGRPALFRNFTINAKHVQILSAPVTDS